ncbi:MAG TPA: hypothetical protein VK890_09310 [Bacteroidia bacterium]|nr:hypothetical protein [Bacteroidia bacterium]
MRNSLQKSLTWEWITIHTKNGLTYERRQRKKVTETVAAIAHDKAEREVEWNNRVSLAGLHDKLATSIKYNHNYYDVYGDPVYVPPRYQDLAEEFHHSKNNDSTFTNQLTGDVTDLEKRKKQRLIGLVKLKDKLFQQEYAKKKEFNEASQNNPVIIKRNIKSFLSTINVGRSSVDDMYYALNYVRARIDPSIDPTIRLTIKGKKQTKTLNELVERLQQAKASKKGDTRANTGVEQLEIENIDHYDPEDFASTQWQMTPTDHADIVARVNKKYMGLKKL